MRSVSVLEAGRWTATRSAQRRRPGRAYNAWSAESPSSVRAGRQRYERRRRRGPRKSTAAADTPGLLTPRAGQRQRQRRPKGRAVREYPSRGARIGFTRSRARPPRSLPLPALSGTRAGARPAHCEPHTPVWEPVSSYIFSGSCRPELARELRMAVRGRTGSRLSCHRGLRRQRWRDTLRERAEAPALSQDRGSKQQERTAEAERTALHAESPRSCIMTRATQGGPIDGGISGAVLTPDRQTVAASKGRPRWARRRVHCAGAGVDAGKDSEAAVPSPSIRVLAACLRRSGGVSMCRALMPAVRWRNAMQRMQVVPSV